MSNTIKVNLALLGAVTLWSGAFVAIRISLNGYSPGSLGLFRFGLAALCFLLPMLFYRRLPRLKIKQALSLFVIGAIGIAAYSLFLNTGEKNVSPGMASFIIAQTPILNTFLAMIFLKERASLNSLVSISISCVGVAIILFGQPIESDFNFGFVLVFSATLCGSIQAILQKQLLGHLSALEVSTISTSFAALVLLFFYPSLSYELPRAPLSATCAAIFLGLVPSTLGQWLWGYGLSKTTVVKASVYLYMMPFLSSFFAWLMLNVVPSQLEFLGGLVALLGAVLVKKKIGHNQPADGQSPSLPIRKSA